MSSLRVEGLRFLGKGPIDLSIDASECVTLAGPSGAGKTLFLRAIADLDESEGAVYVDDVERMSIPAPEWRRRVGFLPAESAWWRERVGEHFAAGIDSAVFAQLGFPAETADWPVSRLSSGERQRLALARLIAIRPEVLLVDEPTANLDDENTDRVEAIVERYRADNGVAVLWVTHDLEQAERIGRRRFGFEGGRLVFDPAKESTAPA